jgi:hypothetical protein
VVARRRDPLVSLEDLFTTVLDWPVADVKPQVDRADIVLTSLGFKWLVLEVKRPVC